jgi:hypothetical protein
MLTVDMKLMIAFLKHLQPRLFTLSILHVSNSASCGSLFSCTVLRGCPEYLSHTPVPCQLCVKPESGSNLDKTMLLYSGHPLKTVQENSEPQGVLLET